MSIKERPATGREDTASLDAQADKLGSFTLGGARVAARTGEDQAQDSDAEPTRSSSRAPHVRRSHRGGRSHNEGSDSELDPNWNMPADEVEQTPEDKARGLAAARRAIEDAKPKQSTAEEIAAARAAQAQEIRRKATESWADQI